MIANGTNFKCFIFLKARPKRCENFQFHLPVSSLTQTLENLKLGYAKRTYNTHIKNGEFRGFSITHIFAIESRHCTLIVNDK